MKIIYSLILLFLLGSHVSAQEIAQDNDDQISQEKVIVDYSYAKMCYAISNFSIFMEVSRIEEQNTYPVLMQFQIGSNTVVTGKTAIINDKEADNPLYNQKILLLSVMREDAVDYPIIVTMQKPSVVYLVGQPFVDSNKEKDKDKEKVENKSNKRFLYSSPDLSEIVGSPCIITHVAPLTDFKFIEIEKNDNSKESEKEKSESNKKNDKKLDTDKKSDKKNKKTQKVKVRKVDHYIAAAVEHTKDDQKSIDLALFMKDYTTTTTKETKDGKEIEKEERHWFLRLVNEIENDKGKKTPQLFPYDQLCKHLSINGGLDSVTICDSYWDPILNRLYVGLHVTTKPDATDQQGAKAIIVLYVDNNQLHACPIAQDDYFLSEADCIVGAVGPNKSIIVNKIKTLHTSTRLPYLIAVGGVGSTSDMSESLKTVYALPLVECYNKNNVQEVKTNPLHGSLASFSDKPLVSSDSKWINRKRFSQAADRMNANSDSAIMVGGMQAPGIISDIRIINDVVFVSVEQADDGQFPGIFRSMPIFNENGCIAAWTPWQRVGGIANSVLGFNIDPKGSCIFLDATYKTVKNEITPMVANWFKFLDPKKNVSYEYELSTIVQQEFTHNHYGITGLYDFSTPSSPLHNNGFLVATGMQKVLLIDPKLLYRHIITSDDSNTLDMKSEYALSLYSPDASHFISLMAGDLEQIGLINAATIVSDDHQSWLVVGGPNGLAVLMDEYGNGWSVNKAIDFNELKAMRFKKVGNHRLIKKLIGNLGSLYVLSHAALERISLNASDLVRNTLRPVTLATNKDQGALFDVAISGALALLATGKGLLMNSNATNVLTASDALELAWKHIELGNQLPAYKIIPFSTTGCAHDFAYHGGQVYVLVGSKSSNNTSIYRLFIKDIKYGIHDDTVTLVNDSFKENMVMPYLHFNAYWNNFYTDGLYSIIAREEKDRSILLLFDPRTYRLNRAKIQYQDLLPETISPKQINAIIQDSSSGCLLIAGDFGLSIH